MNTSTTTKKTTLGVSEETASDIGKRLHDARDAIQRTTLEISQRIKVREHYVIAMENGDWSRLPPGLNGRGLVRLYAKELKVNVPELQPKDAPSTNEASDLSADIRVIQRSPAEKGGLSEAAVLVRSVLASH